MPSGAELIADPAHIGTVRVVSSSSVELPESIQDVPVAPSDLQDTESELSSSELSAASAPDPVSASAERTVVYVVAVLSLLVVLWALIEGGERDLWNVPSTSTLVTWFDMQLASTWSSGL